MTFEYPEGAPLVLVIGVALAAQWLVIYTAALSAIRQARKRTDDPQT